MDRSLQASRSRVTVACAADGSVLAERERSRAAKPREGWAGFSFEAGGRTFRPVVSQSMPIFEGFVLLFYYIFFYFLFKENLSELQPCLRN